MTETMRIGQTTIVDDAGALTATEKRLASLAAFWARAGIHTGSANRWGERVATYGWTHNAKSGSAPGWIQRAQAHADAVAAVHADDMARAAVFGAGDMPRIIDAIGADAALSMRKQAEAGDLYETGDLVRAIQYGTQDKILPRTGSLGSPGRKKRIASSAAQEFYQLYHKGRSRSMRNMRKSVSYAAFKQRYGQSYIKAEAHQREYIARVMTTQRNAASRAANSIRPGYYNRSQRELLQSMLLGARPQLHTDSFEAARARALDRANRRKARAERAASRRRR